MSKCPICTSKSNPLKSFSETEIKKLLSNHFHNDCPVSVEILDYTVFECGNCKFQFAHPFIQGSNSFYNWVTKQENYYPISRWEYQKVLSLTSSKNEVSILDVGCGDANFFEVLRNSGKPYNMLGIDTTESSIDKCAQKGFNAICMDLDQYISRFPDEKFDFVVSFHCLEHLTNPIDFLTKLLTLLKDGGVLFISTPFSPLTIEADWIDILNYPPHHMGRWNCSSYLEIAKKLSVNVEFYHPRNLNWFYDSVESFLISEYNVPVKNITNLRKSFLLKFLIKPHKFIYHIFRQLFRDKINNQRASNVILAKFYK